MNLCAFFVNCFEEIKKPTKHIKQLNWTKINKYTNLLQTYHHIFKKQKTNKQNIESNPILQAQNWLSTPTFPKKFPPKGTFPLSYCWWTKSCTTKDDDYPTIHRVLTIPIGAGFRPSTVCHPKKKRPPTKQPALPWRCPGDVQHHRWIPWILKNGRFEHLKQKMWGFWWVFQALKIIEKKQFEVQQSELISISCGFC